MGVVYQHGVYYSTCAKLTKHHIQLFGFHQGLTPVFSKPRFAKIVVCVPYAMVDVYFTHCPFEMKTSLQKTTAGRQSSFYCGWQNGQEVWSSVVVDEWKLQDYLQIFSNRLIKIHIIDVDVYVLWHLVFRYLIEHKKILNIVLALYQHSQGVYGLIGRNECLWTVINVANLNEIWSRINLEPQIVLSLNIDVFQLEPYASNSMQFLSVNLEKEYVMSSALALRGLYANT
jgi:hypothetical protein